MSTILDNVGKNEYGNEKRIHMKGASEYILESCSHYINQEGNKVELLDEMKQHLLEIITQYAKGALRTIGIAYKDMKENEGGSNHSDIQPN